MARPPQPTISAVVAAYQSERWLGEALDSILDQTRPPDEVVVVDDGSTDGTAAILSAYGDRIRVIRQPNGGCPAAFNTAFRAARGDFVAMCGSDDVWHPDKLAWQEEAIAAHPEVDVLFGHAILVGTIEGDHARPPATGLLDSAQLRDALYAELSVCAPTVVIRRSLFERLGPFVENFGADDYEYWMRSLRHGARFYYDPRPLLSYRQHGGNLSAKRLWMDECVLAVLRRYEEDIPDRDLVDRRMAPLLFRHGRDLVDAGRVDEARSILRDALRHRRGARPADSARVLAWVAVLGLPPGPRARFGRALVSLSRSASILARRLEAAAR